MTRAIIIICSIKEIFKITMNQRQKALSNKTVFISCIVPVFNEEAVIQEFIKSLHGELNRLSMHYEIIVVDDGSNDLTLEKLAQLSKEFSIKLLGLSRNFGKEAALTAGLEHCSGDVAILMDADFQHPIEVLS